MKPNLLRRLEVLERTIDQSSRPPLRLVEVTKLLDREHYWSGREGEIAVLTRIGVPVDTPAGSGIHTIIVDVSEASRDRWQATEGMDDDALEAFEQRAAFGEQLREKEAREARERKAVEAIRNQREPLPTAPANAYSVD